MSYDTSNRKKAKPSEQQALLPDALRSANVQIEGQLTKFQNNMRNLIHLKEDIGTEKDNDDLRTLVQQKVTEMNTQSKELQVAIDEYGQISVPYRSQRQQTEKQEAYNKRLAEIVNKYKQETQEIHVKMQQHLDLVKRRNTLRYNDSSGDLHQDGSENQLLQQQTIQLDVEELKIQGEAAYMEDVINQRQEELNNVEKFMTDINDIAKEINTKVHEQRTDLVEIVDNTTEAEKNAIEAEKNIEEAQEHQKSGGKCMYWIIAAIAIAVLIIIIIVIVALT